jgi:PII-like signaling protein
MERVCIRFYATESQRHGSKLVHEWLLERAKALGVPGGTALRAIAGYGRHGILHEETFFELAGDVPVEIEFIADAPQTDALLEMLKTEKVHLFYVRMPVTSGVSGSA